jgi:hypothetical protein
LPTERVERRLAAVLAADVSGYSRLIGADEEGTLARLKAHRRELIDPKIAEHRGRIVKTTGDGVLIEFAVIGEQDPRTLPGRCGPTGFDLKAPSPASGRAFPGKLKGSFDERLASNFVLKSPLPGLVPGTHVLRQRQSSHRRRGWPGQARPRGYFLVAQES